MEYADAKSEEYKVYVDNEKMKISVSEDTMRAYILLHPPKVKLEDIVKKEDNGNNKDDAQKSGDSINGDDSGNENFKNEESSKESDVLTEEDINKELHKAGIVYGINDALLGELVANPVYDKFLLFAEGLPMVQGENGYVEYKFNTDRNLRPQHNPNGTVNFRKLNNISHVEQGDLLAVLHLAVRGKEGTNVFGKTVKPAAVSEAVIRFGNNVAVSEDKTKIYSLVNGHVSLDSGRVFVSNVFEVPSNVDNSTGDIEYNGSILVRGDVRTGFKIKASGDIEVIGIVEDAEIVAGGDVVLHHGIHGRVRGTIVAKGNIVSKFIENARVYAGGYIETEAIIQSHVSANGDVLVNGVKGYIIGGHTRSGGKLESKIIGSDLGISTIVEVGFNPMLLDEIEDLKKQVAEKSTELEKNKQLLEVLRSRQAKNSLNAEQKKLYVTCLNRIRELQEELPGITELLHKREASIKNNSNSSVAVRDKVYPGAKIVVLGECLNILKPDGFCKYYNEGGAVRTKPL